MKRNLCWEQDWIKKLSGWPERCSYKGGFILPRDIQDATIVFADDIVAAGTAEEE